MRTDTFQGRLNALLDEMVEARAAERVAKIIQGLQPKAPRTAETAKPVKARKTSGRGKNFNPLTRICAVPECPKAGTGPRNGLVCADHVGLSAEKKREYREMAKRPGGKWSREKVISATAAKAAAPAEQPAAPPTTTVAAAAAM